jgi:hypothetical protein
MCDIHLNGQSDIIRTVPQQAAALFLVLSGSKPRYPNRGAALSQSMLCRVLKMVGQLCSYGDIP